MGGEIDLKMHVAEGRARGRDAPFVLVERMGFFLRARPASALNAVAPEMNAKKTTKEHDRDIIIRWR